jgi:16S rRNA (cytosine967-C5)-methyltransferase
MIAAARLAAAIEVMGEIEARRRPAADALKDWGLSHRFAGSKDRAAIADLVFDALRVRASSAWLMGAETPRAILLGALRENRGYTSEAVAALCTGEGHAPAPLSAEERAHLDATELVGAPAAVAGNFPDWLEPSLSAVFGDDLVAETRALAIRPKLDLRVNTLKATREKAVSALAHLDAAPCLLSPVGLRLPLLPDGRSPTLAAEPAYAKGLVEVQDEGSQIAALLTGAKQGEQVLDLCAGGGGKSLALAALMQNKGQIYASDRDGTRLMAIHPRLTRAGARNIQVRAPRRGADGLADLENRCDLVLIDAPCTGTGTWRRNPDAKWRMRPGALAQRMKEQDELLDAALRFVKPGGRLVYVTCSLLREENEDRLEAFRARQGDAVAPIAAAALAAQAGLPQLEGYASRFGAGLRLTPLTAGTDGFFIGALLRN